MKMPKVPLVGELWNCTLASNYGRVLPRVDCNITKVSFFQRSCILIFVIKKFVSILEFMSDELFNVPIKQLSPLEKTSSLLVNHVHSGISTPINNTNNIPICLGIVYHEPLEIGICYIFLPNNCI
jgi:hypothetical protein